MGLSGKFEQLESPSSVSDISEILLIDKICFLLDDSSYNFFLVIRTIKSFHHQQFLMFTVISYLVFTDSAFLSFLSLWIVIGRSRIFDKTLSLRPPLVIEKDRPKKGLF